MLRKQVIRIGLYKLKGYCTYITSYLDIERELIIQKINNVKEQCYTILEEVNKNLSPYHWEMQEDRNDIRRYCYLIGLFKGENRLKNTIIGM